MTTRTDCNDLPAKPARRIALKAGATLLLSVMAPGMSLAAQIMAVRVWPAPDYTRVTLESDTALTVSHFLVKDPLRMVVDITGLDLNPELKSLVAKIQPNDPYIQQVRVGQNQPQVVRLVFDLKAEVVPQVFSLAPVGSYRNRLVFDLYPTAESDPIAELFRQHAEREKQVALTPQLTQEPAVPSSPAAIPSRPGRTAPTLTGKWKRLVTVTLDPGHGGEDPGAVGRGGSYEKNVVLSIAKRLKTKLEAYPNVRVNLTRDDDFFVPLHVRVQKARRLKSDLFVSIHADAWIEPHAKGASVFALSEQGASSAAARWLAKKENDADLIGGANVRVKDATLARVLLDMSTTAQIQDSLKLGRAVLSELGHINTLHKPRVEQAGFAVLKAPDIPSILVETAFISNPEEEAKLNDEAYQEKMAQALANGIITYLNTHLPAPQRRV